MTGGLNLGRIETRELEQEMRSSFLDYAMSVIVARALPDVRDGLKPVHRRVLYGMHEAGMQPNRPYKKCARIVGDVMGSYHPHGDTAIYDTLVRLAQPFSMRYPLVDGQGNFGNIDGYPAAAMRYTECRLTRLATELLRDIDADTVDFEPNYDESRREPVVLPARFPNLLVNGSSGIAVGMATNIPPHHLGETIDALVAMIDDPSIDVERLMRHVKGPDFPTAGIIVGREGIREAYRSGRGRIVMRARAHIEELRGGKHGDRRQRAAVRREEGRRRRRDQEDRRSRQGGTIPEVADLKDLSDKSGMRIQIAPQARRRPAGRAEQALQAHAAADDVRLQRRRARRRRAADARSARPALPLPRAPARRSSRAALKYELRQAEARAHVLEGYLIALDNLDEVIALIRGAADTDEARSGLIERFELSEIQAQAILDLRLRALTGLERKRIEDEFTDLQERIAELRAILGDEARIDARHPRGAARDQVDLRPQRRPPHGDRRRRRRARARGPDRGRGHGDRDHALGLHQAATGHHVPRAAARRDRRDGHGAQGRGLHRAPLRRLDPRLHPVLHVRRQGLPAEGARASARLAPVEGPRDRQPAPVPPGRAVRAVIQTRDFKEAEYLVFATKNGVVKKTKLEEYNTPLKADGIIAIKMREGDELVGVRHTSTATTTS